MKKILFLFFIVIGTSSVSHAQSAGKGSNDRSSSKRKPHSQMSHFDKQRKDPNIKHNGTSYNRNSKSSYKVDGNGFSGGSRDSRRKGKKTGIH
jgi:hypothetical protein